MDAAPHLDYAALQGGLDEIRPSPRDEGCVLGVQTRPRISVSGDLGLSQHRTARGAEPRGSQTSLDPRLPPGDLEALYPICLLTGDDGQDATSLYRDPRLLGHVFAPPYGLFEPSLAFVAEDDNGVAGYIVGALDSQAFEERLENEWWPRLRERHPEPPPSFPDGRWTDQHITYLIHHPWRTPDELAGRYPSHLHLNLLTRLQASGYGRQLITTLIAALRDQWSPGLHLHVSPGNTRAAGFYQHVGFTELPATGLRVFGMDLRNNQAL